MGEEMPAKEMAEMMNHSHGDPTFFSLWRPDILLLAILIGLVYFYFTGRGRHRFAGAEPVAAVKKFLFVMALVTLYIGQGSPLAFYGHGHLFSAHMMQQSLLYLVMPPLVYLAIPDWMWRPFLNNSALRRRLKPLMHPLLAVLLFNGLFSVYHIPLIFDAAYSSPALHYAYHIVLLITAFHMWFPVFCPDREWSRMSELQKIAYIVVDGILLTPACALIIFADSLLYDVYRHTPSVFSSLSHYNDQQLGGTVMKIMQEIVYGVVLAYVFFTWYRRERKKEDEDDHPGGPEVPPGRRGQADSAPLKHLPSH